MSRAKSATRLEFAFPPKALSPNDRGGWRKKANATASYREEVGWIALASAPSAYRDDYWPLTPPVEATVTFVVPDRRRRDEQNFLQMLKPAFDGLVDAGVLTDDNHEVFKVTATHFVVGEPKVIVVLKGVEW